jgi:hypothetical protein
MILKASSSAIATTAGMSNNPTKKAVIINNKINETKMKGKVNKVIPISPIKGILPRSPIIKLPVMRPSIKKIKVRRAPEIETHFLNTKSYAHRTK